MTTKKLDYNIDYKFDSNEFKNIKLNHFILPSKIYSDYIENVKLYNKHFNYYKPDNIITYNPYEQIKREEDTIKQIDDIFLQNTFSQK